jgi:transcriptional regulator with GAF, ATPase, and Fis domain
VTISRYQRSLPGRIGINQHRAESIASVTALPLVGASGPIGAMVLGSRKENSFTQADLDLLSQVSSQISLAIDNALAYGRFGASRDHLEDQRVYLKSEISSEYNFEDIVGRSSAFQGRDANPLCPPELRELRNKLHAMKPQRPASCASTSRTLAPLG